MRLIRITVIGGNSGQRRVCLQRDCRPTRPTEEKPECGRRLPGPVQASLQTPFRNPRLPRHPASEQDRASISSASSGSCTTIAGKSSTRNPSSRDNAACPSRDRLTPGRSRNPVMRAPPLTGTSRGARSRSVSNISDPPSPQRRTMMSRHPSGSTISTPQAIASNVQLTNNIAYPLFRVRPQDGPRYQRYPNAGSGAITAGPADAAGASYGQSRKTGICTDAIPT